jgi:hypothetical protein
MCEKIIDPSILSADSTLIKAKGHVWHKSSMEEGVVPRSAGIDTADAMWGDSAIQRAGYLWIQTTFDIKYRFYHCTFGCRFYNCQHTYLTIIRYTVH